MPKFFSTYPMFSYYHSVCFNLKSYFYVYLSGRVDDLATELGKTMTSIAIGSEEGFTQADKAINTASKNGRWVLLKVA